MINRFVSFVIDAVLVTLFVVLGMASHSTPFSEFLATAWPFWVGMVIGWFAWVLLKPSLPGSGLRAGLVVWGCTVAFGLLFRILAGGGVSGAFPYITLGVLALFILGWRLIHVISTRSAAKKRTGIDGDKTARQPQVKAPAKKQDRQEKPEKLEQADSDPHRPVKPQGEGNILRRNDGDLPDFLKEK